MGQLADIESELVEQLTAAFTKEGDARPWLKVEAWPVKPEGYRLPGAGDVFVMYRGARYHIEDTSSMFYNAVLQYEISLRARTLRDHSGAYEMVETARQATCGHKLKGAAGVTVPVHDGFVEYGEGVFAYSLVISLPVLLVPEASTEPPGPWLEEDQGGAELRAIRMHMQLSGGQ